MQFKRFTPRILVRGDYQVCYDFYTEKLGFVPTWGDRNGPYTSFAIRSGEPACFAIFAGAAMAKFKGYVQPTTSQQPDTIVASILSDDIEADYKRMKEAGVVFIGELQLMDWGAKHVNFRDPEGNLLELTDGDV